MKIQPHVKSTWYELHPGWDSDTFKVEAWVEGAAAALIDIGAGAVAAEQVIVSNMVVSENGDSVELSAAYLRGGTIDVDGAWIPGPSRLAARVQVSHVPAVVFVRLSDNKPVTIRFDAMVGAE